MPVELRTYKKRFRPLQLNQGNCVVFATQTRGGARMRICRTPPVRLWFPTR